MSKYDIIIAATPSLGIGFKGKMAWCDSDELKLFREKTREQILIMGRKTIENLPKLKDRIILCLSSQKNLDTSSYKNEVTVFNDLSKALTYAQTNYPHKKVFIAGGSQIYSLALQNLHNIGQIHISIMKKDYRCDSTFSIDFSNFVIMSKEEYPTFSHMVMKSNHFGESQYLSLLSNVLNVGKLRQGRNGRTLSIFSPHLLFDLRDGFPLLTTKQMFLKGIIEELLFFLRGETDSKKLEEQGVNIWKGNTNRKFLDSIGMTKRREGIMGQMYGAQWRHFNGDYDEETGESKGGVDQLKYVVKMIKTKPHSRRILMTDFNPGQVNSGVLFPCHSIVLQFYVDDQYLDCFCYNRSSDLFLGLPFNIASTSLLIMLIGKLTELTPRFFNLTLGDAHIYEEHLEAVKEQIVRQPYMFPKIEITKEMENVEDLHILTREDFTLSNYQFYPRIKVEMVP